jgi:hypothetical protein
MADPITIDAIAIIKSAEAPSNVDCIWLDTTIDLSVNSIQDSLKVYNPTSAKWEIFTQTTLTTTEVTAIVEANTGASSGTYLGLSDVDETTYSGMDYFVAYITPEGNWKFKVPSVGSKTLTVSPAGDDATAQAGNILFHYKTILAAQTASSSGDMIDIYAGTYTDVGLGKNGVTYNYRAGAIHSGATAIFDTSTNDVGFDVTGYGEFIGTDDVFVLGEGNVNLTDNRIYHIQAKSVTCNASSSVGLYLRGGRHFLDVDEVILGHVYAHGIQTANLIEVFGEARKVYPTVASDAMGTSLCILYCDTGSTVNLKFNQLTKDDHAVLSTALFDIQSDGDTYIEFNKCNFGGTNYSGDAAIYVGGNGNTTIKGDITSVAQHGLKINNSAAATPTVHYSGKITTGTVAAVLLDIPNATLTLEGEFTTTGAQAIDLDDGTLRIRNARIESTYNNAAGHSITKDGGTLTLEGAVLVQAHASANSVNAEAPEDIKVYQAVSKYGKSVNISEQVGSIVADTNVE